MIIQCPDCGTRREVTEIDPDGQVLCRCPARLKTPSSIISRQTVRLGSGAVCRECGRSYDDESFRQDTEILCTCGNVLEMEFSSRSSGRGRRKSDRERSSWEEELTALIDLCKLMNAAIDTESLLRTIMKLSSTILNVEGSTIMLKSKSGEELIFHVVSGEKAGDLKQMRISIRTGIAGWVVRNNMPALVNKVDEDGRFSPVVDQTTDFSTKSILCVPLRARDRIIGALEVVNKRTEDGFTDKDLGLAEAIASQAGEAIERARLVEENIERQRLAAIGETVAGLAHCIKNILNGLEGGAYMVNTGIKGDKNETTEKGWRIVEKNIKRISNLALDMLNYSKEREPVMELTDVNEMVRDIIDLMEDRAAANEVNINFKDDDTLEPFLFDSSAIHRCVMNLVSNAIDACSGTGSGEVRVSTIRHNDESVYLAVHDNGCGMDDKIKQKLETSFFSTKGSKGTGLGLPVTRKILREHGGELKIESVEGIGSTFTCRLPYRRK